MLLPKKIQFQELSTSAAEFLHELNDPSLLRNQKILPVAALELRRQQVLKIRANIALLEAKRGEFNRKMQDYIRNLEALIRSLEESIAADVGRIESAEAQEGQGTTVRCLGCETEAFFQDLQIIFARESEESMALPTEVYVLAGGILKKGHFCCGSCGTEGLVIRAC